MITSREQQNDWLAERDRRRFLPNRADFLTGGLASFLDEPRVVVSVLGPYPLAPELAFEQELLHVLPERFTGRTANGTGFLPHTVTTADFLGRYADGHGIRAWRAYVCLSRSGCVEVGLGRGAVFELRPESENSPLAFRLYYIVHAIRVAVESQSRLQLTRSGSELAGGPFELTVGLRETDGVYLEGLADGWGRAAEFGWQCLTGAVLVRRQLESWPADETELESVIVEMGDRVCNAFGATDRLFAPRHGNPGAGILSREYA